MATIALNFKTNAKETDREMIGLGESISAVGSIATKAFTAMAAGAVLLGGAITTLAINSAKNEKSLINMARLAGLGAREFAKLTFATEKYDITAEQFSDISKDVTEKLGEFAAVGTGGFQDFADIMKLSKSDAQALAKELGAMPAPQALLQITSMLEGAGVGRADMSFALESLGSDLTKLMPLLADGGKEWEKINKQFDKATSTFALTAEKSGDLLELADAFDLLALSGSTVATFFSAQFGPAITSVIKEMTDTLGEKGFQAQLQNVSVAMLEFGVFALQALSPVVSIVQMLLDGLNKIGTALSVVVSGASGFIGALGAGASIGESADIAAGLENEARDRGVRREQAISDIGGGLSGGIEGLTSTLQSLQRSIERGNTMQVKSATQLNDAGQATKDVVRRSL